MMVFTQAFAMCVHTLSNFVFLFVHHQKQNSVHPYFSNCTI